MSSTARLSECQQLASRLEADLDAVALRLRSMAAHLHAIRAVGMLDAAVREIGAALMQEQLRGSGAPSNDVPLSVEVISPGADRSDAIVRSLSDVVEMISARAITVRLGLRYDAEGTRQVDEIMRRNGWRRDGAGWWRRPGYGAAAATAAGQPR